MKSKQAVLNKVATSMAHKMIRKDSDGWPPYSQWNFYQPVRPQEKPTTAHRKSASVKALEKS